jgi:hypothetical protein
MEIPRAFNKRAMLSGRVLEQNFPQGKLRADIQRLDQRWLLSYMTDLKTPGNNRELTYSEKKHLITNKNLPNKALMHIHLTKGLNQSPPSPSNRGIKNEKWIFGRGTLWHPHRLQ